MSSTDQSKKGEATALRARKFEVRIFNQSKDVAERIENGGHANSFANILNVRALGGTERKQTFQRCIGIGDAPVNNYSARTCGRGWIGIETELVTVNVKANVKRLVEVWFDSEDL